MAKQQDLEQLYTYVYQPGAPTERNVRESMAMDGLRARLSQARAEEMLTVRFRERGSAGPGPAPESEDGEEVAK